MQNQKTQKSLVAKVLVLFASVALMFVGIQVFADAALNLNTFNLPKQIDKLTFKSDEEAKNLDSVVKVLKAIKADQNFIDLLIDENVDVTTDVTDTNAKKVKIVAKAEKSSVITGQATFTYVVDTDKVVVATPWYKSWWFLTLVVVTVVAVAGGVVFFVKKNKKN